MESTGEDSENSQKFYEFFQQEMKTLQEQIDRLADPTLAAEERSDATDECLAGIASLSRKVNNATAFIPAYDQRTYSQSTKALQTRLQQTRAASAPKQKFSFKNAPRALRNPIAVNRDSHEASLSTSKISEHPQPPTFQSLGSSGEPSVVVSIYSLENRLVTLRDYSPTSPTPANHPRTATLRAINRSIVNLGSPPPSNESRQQQQQQSEPPFASMTLRSISSSLLLLHRVDGPVHLTSIQNCTLVASCRQFRMHDSSACDVYLACGSRPIIEGCSGVRFAALPEVFCRAWGLEVPAADKDGFETGPAPGRAEGSGQWDQVDDFGWLVAGKQSPNWRVLEAWERVQEDIWNRVVGGASPGVEDALRALGILPL